MAVSTPICDFGWRAPDFMLPATDGKNYRLQDIRGTKGTLIIFMCNHCPYVIAVKDRIIRDAKDLLAQGIGIAGISANDAIAYPEDSFENMKKVCLPFPYLYDENQEVARAYDAVCTPDFFGFDANLGLQYRGRLDASGRSPASPDTPRELYDAMLQVAKTGQGPSEQISSMGCSIKWKMA